MLVVKDLATRETILNMTQENPTEDILVDDQLRPSLVTVDQVTVDQE